MNTSDHVDNMTVSYEGDTTSEGFFQICGITTIVISLVGIPGNVLVILSVCLNKDLRTAPNILVLNLSVCDLLFLSLAVPYQACSLLKAQPCIPELCWVSGFVFNWLIGSSILNTVSIALNRYISIVYQGRYRGISKNKTIIATCIGAYTLPVVLISPIFFDRNLGDFVFDEEDRLCAWTNDAVMKTVLVFVIGVSPLIFMTVCYIRILMFVVASKKRVGALGLRAAGPAAQRPTEKRLSLMLAMVYVVYLITTFPSFVISVVKGMGVIIPLYLDKFTFLLVWTSSAINPIVYGLVNKKYREAYKSILMKIPVPFKTTETVETNTG